MEKTWGILMHLGYNLAGDKKEQKVLAFDKEVWDKVVAKCVEAGLNTIVLDLLEGIRYDSHPELGAEGAWMPAEATAEVRRLREMGIRLIPKLNFSSMHSVWLGKYARMISTPEYYQVCKDLIKEVYEMFEHPDYIHIGMDEENWKHVDDPGYTFICLRRDELFFHDLNYLADCVKETGAKCHIWHDAFSTYGDAAYENISKDIIPETWMYYSYLKKHWHKISEQSQEVIDFYATRFVRRYGYTIEYVEESPSVIDVMKQQKRFIEEGRHFLIATSNLYTKTCEADAVEYIKEICPELSLIEGFVTTTWSQTVKDKEELILEAVELMGKARQKWYK